MEISNINMKSTTTITYILLLLALCVQANGITLNYVGGHIYITCDIAVGEDTIAANLIIDLGMAYPLILDKEFASSLESKDNTTTVILSKSNRLTNIPFQSTDLNELREFTKRYAAQLKEVPICGIIGLSAFDNAPVLLDIQDGKLEYGDVLSMGDDWQSINLIQTESGYRIAVQPAADYTLQSGITTGSYETWIDATCASIAGFPGGDFEFYKMGLINLMDYTSVRPSMSDSSSRPDAMIGNSFWQNFQVVFDPAGKKILLSSKGQKTSDLHEQIYFKALIDEDANAIEAYVDAYPSSRLLEEATETLLAQRLIDSLSDSNAIEKACNKFIHAVPPKDAAEKLIGYADRLFEEQKYETDTIPFLLKKALSCTLKTSDAALLSYEAQGRLGRYAILKKNWTDARLYLLSALFGQPTNPDFNYWMGQYYEEKGLLIRAWSRYLKACLSDTPTPQAITAIQNLNNNSKFRAQFSIHDANEFLEGYTLNYPAAILLKGLDSNNGGSDAE